jgi:hypothetical protein
MRAGKTCTGVTLSQDFGQDLVTIATNRSEQGRLCNYKKDPCILFMEFLSQNKKDLDPVMFFPYLTTRVPQVTLADDARRHSNQIYS